MVSLLTFADINSLKNKDCFMFKVLSHRKSKAIHSFMTPLSTPSVQNVWNQNEDAVLKSTYIEHMSFPFGTVLQIVLAVAERSSKG